MSNQFKGLPMASKEGDYFWHLRSYKWPIANGAIWEEGMFPLLYHNGAFLQFLYAVMQSTLCYVAHP